MFAIGMVLVALALLVAGLRRETSTNWVDGVFNTGFIIGLVLMLTSLFKITWEYLP